MLFFQRNKIKSDKVGPLRLRSTDTDSPNNGIGRSISQEDLISRIDLLEANYHNLHSRFLTFGTNLTQQLQRQENRASLSWVSTNWSNILPTNENAHKMIIRCNEVFYFYS